MYIAQAICCRPYKNNGKESKSLLDLRLMPPQRAAALE
jgi:hypothetical protein